MALETPQLVFIGVAILILFDLYRRRDAR